MKIVISVALTLLLCACVTNPPVPVSAVSVPPPAPAESAVKAPESYKSQRIITPVEIIEKDKLRVSYSLKVAPGVSGYLVQVSMVFRNKKEQSIRISPKITLSDGKDATLKSYSKKSFIRLAAGKPEAAEKIKWANSYWLKESFSIPANGIEIAELAFHSTSLNYPMKLKVSAAHQDFVFTISESQQVASSQP